MEPELLHSFVGIRSEELPPELEHLVRRSDQEYYSRYGTTTLTMQVVLQQILHRPYQGLANRGKFAAAFRHKFGVNPSAYRRLGRTVGY